MCGPLTVDICEVSHRKHKSNTKIRTLYCLDFVFPIFMFNIVKHLE